MFKGCFCGTQVNQILGFKNVASFCFFFFSPMLLPLKFIRQYALFLTYDLNAETPLKLSFHLLLLPPREQERGHWSFVFVSFLGQSLGAGCLAVCWIQDRRGTWSEKVRECHFKVFDIIFKWSPPACMVSVRSAVLLNAVTPGWPLLPCCTVSCGILSWFREYVKSSVFLWTLDWLPRIFYVRSL